MSSVMGRIMVVVGVLEVGFGVWSLLECIVIKS